MNHALSLPSSTLQKPVALVFGLTLFLSASIMFALQPMTGKMLLPIVGGTPAGWITAMAFFQIMLLLGYLLAHLMSRFSPWLHAFLHMTALCLGVFFLPVTLPQPSAGAVGAFDIFFILSKSLAFPVIALSATSSTLQRLFTTTGHVSTRDPYFLYAASNLGSFAGLFAYPLLIEPLMTLPEQTYGWFMAYLALMAFCLACLALAGKKTTSAVSPSLSFNTPWRQQARWVLLAFIPSSLMLGVTTHITTDIFSLPMVWIVPLGLYLLTFVAAFSKKTFISYDLVVRLHPVAVGAVIALMTLISENAGTSWQAMMCHLAAFTIVALVCHMQLAKSRPLESDRQMTAFYLLISIGGALGGIMNAFIAPLILNTLVEYPLVLILSCLVHPHIRSKFSARQGLFFLFGCGIMLIMAATLHGEDVQDKTAMIRDTLLISIFILVTLHPRATIIAGVIAYILSHYIWVSDEVRLRERNFYGTMQIYDRVFTFDTVQHSIRFLKHGTTVHGFQLHDPDLLKTPTAYFTEQGPVGDIFNVYSPKNIAVMGLGTGTINCYSKPDNHFTFFEIDPDVVRIAKTEFSFLELCSHNEPRIILGDGRLEMAKLQEKFDLIILDAFSSDMIPTHLVTEEAMRVYLDRLNPGGMMLFNISNRFFRMENILARTAGNIGLKNRSILDRRPESPHGYASKWIIIAPVSTSLNPLDDFGWQEMYPSETTRPWSDDYSNFISAINL